MRETTPARYKRLGLCVRCGNTPADGMSMCRKHLDEVKCRRRNRLSAGKCAYCINSAISGKTICQDCTLKRSKERDERISVGLCCTNGCTNNARLNKRMCSSCTDKISNKTRILKQTVLNHYGQKCNCSCGCTVVKFKHLTMDHKNNDGAKQRRDKNSHCGQAEYRRIIREGFPDDLQVLCWNCNCAKQYYGGCGD